LLSHDSILSRHGACALPGGVHRVLDVNLHVVPGDAFTVPRITPAYGAPAGNALIVAGETPGDGPGGCRLYVVSRAGVRDITPAGWGGRTYCAGPPLPFPLEIDET